MVIKKDEKNLAKRKGFYVLAQSDERVEEIPPRREQLRGLLSFL